MIRTAKRDTSNSDGIKVETLYEHFNTKLGSDDNCASTVYHESVRTVTETYEQLRHVMMDKVITETMLSNYIGSLKSGCSRRTHG